LPASLDAFEGEIDATMKDAKSKDGPAALALLVKDGKVRADIPESMTKHGGSPLGGAGYVIVDTATKKMSLVNDPRRQVFVFDLDKGSDMLKNLGGPHPAKPGAPPAGPQQKLAKTGRYETVAGYRCEDWDVTSDHREGTLCVAELAASWLHLPLLGGAPADKAWVAELLDGKHLPLRFVGYDKDGTTEEGRFEVTKIDPHPLQAAQFEVPAGYATFDLAKMMQGMQGMPGAPGGPPGMPGVMPSGLRVPPPPSKP
jgi:Domain of unknown function (DUF4412)